MKERLPKTHEWTCRYAERIKRKGRAKMGMVLDKKEQGEVGSRLIQKEGGVIKSKLREKNGTLIMYTAYNKEGNNLKNRFNKKKGRRRRRDNHRREDFNIRINKLGNSIYRNSRNKGGKKRGVKIR